MNGPLTVYPGGTTVAEEAMARASESVPAREATLTVASRAVPRTRKTPPYTRAMRVLIVECGSVDASTSRRNRDRNRTGPFTGRTRRPGRYG